MGTMIARIPELVGAEVLWGGKALPLRALAGAGFSVPEGFCQGADALATFLRHNRIPACFEESIRRPGRQAKRIREGSFPPEMAASLDKAFAELRASSPEGASFIARSSSPLEDGRDFSAAGLFESIEGIRDAQGLLAAVKACWASLYSDRALAAFLDRSGGSRRDDLPEPRMAVLVQRWVPGDLSGVCFTCDVKEGRTDRLALNWVEGPCRGLVDGSAPSRFAVFSKGSRELLSAPDGAGEDLAKLVSLCADFERVEAVLGHPCDIEWTHDGQRLWILQARPVTTLRLPPASVPEWLSQPGWNYIPYNRCLRPLEEEAWLASMEGANRAGDEQGCDFLREEARCFRGHAYSRSKGQTGTATVDMVAMANRAIGAGTDLYRGDALPRIRAVQKPLERSLRRRPSRASAAGLVRAAIEHARQSAYLHWTAVWGLAYVDPWVEGVHSLRQDLPELYERLTPTDRFDLLYAPSGATRLRAFIVKMAALVRRSPALSEAFSSIASDRLLYLRLWSLRGGRALLGLLGRTVQAWGFSQIEGDWRGPFAPPPVLSPWAILGELRSFLLGRLPLADQRRSLLERQRKLERSFLASLPAARRHLARSCLLKARRAFTTREEHAVHFDSAKFGYFLAAADHAAVYMAAQKLLEKPEDIFFLSSAEIEAAIADDVAVDRALLTARKADWAESTRLRPPCAAVEPGRNPGAEEASPSSEALPDSAELRSSLAGQASMDSLVRGRAWFPDKAAPSEKDQLILVVPYERSIILQPYLSRIAAVVYDDGSPFSHLAISAREWGIPVMYGTKTACSVLRNGQAVVLDGKAGLLRY